MPVGLVTRMVKALALLIVLVVVVALVPTLVVWPLLPERKCQWLYDVLRLMSVWTSKIVSAAEPARANAGKSR